MVNFHFVKGDIFESPAEMLVNPVNTKGASGAGLHAYFAKKFPKNEKIYKGLCKREKGFHIGDIYTGFEENGKIVCYFPTKDDWKYPSKMEYITEGLRELVRLFKGDNPPHRSIAIPALGSGLGGLNWEDVKLEIITAFELTDIKVNIDVYLYEPLDFNDESKIVNSWVYNH